MEQFNSHVLWDEILVNLRCLERVTRVACYRSDWLLVVLSALIVLVPIRLAFSSPSNSQNFNLECLNIHTSSNMATDTKTAIVPSKRANTDYPV